MTRKPSLGDRGDSAYESMGLRKYRAGFKKPVLKCIRMERDVVGKNSGQVGWGQALRLFTAVFRALRVGSEVWGRKSVAPDRSKCRTGNHKTLRREQRQNSL